VFQPWHKQGPGAAIHCHGGSAVQPFHPDHARRRAAESGTAGELARFAELRTRVEENLEAFSRLP
jgi:hypothetical protein